MLRFLLEKEFKQAFRDSAIMKMLIMMPVMMILIMPWAATQEIKDINLSVVNSDHSPYSKRLVDKIVSSGYFHLTDVSTSNQNAMQSIETNKADLILDIQPNFEKSLIKNGSANVMLSANAVNGTKGGIGSAYLTSILSDFANEIRTEVAPTGSNATSPTISITTQNRFNPRLDYKVFMIPALMVMLITQLGGFFPALNIVGEKEAGTIEQINVTPVNRLIFIIAKLIPYWCIGFIMMSICLGLAALVYGLMPVGNLFTIYAFAMLYILVISGLGLVVSNYSETMQQAMFVMFFFTMVFNLMSGLYTPISSMPTWAQDITVINPLKYFIQVMRMVYLKGSGYADLGTQFLALTIMAVFSNIWAIVSYKKTN